MGSPVQRGVAVVTGQAHRVTGVVLDSGDFLPADLVVDCSGRGSRSDRWLAALGLPAPPREKLAGIVLPVEGDRWLVGLGGWHSQRAPADAADMLRQARSLPHPAIGDLMTRLEPLTDVVAYGFPTSRRRRFERLRRPPAGYLAAGDAICSFNPVYGQGMTCAALEALALGRALDRQRGVTAALAHDFYREAARVIAVPWRFAVGADFAYPETTGPRPPAVAALNAYSRRLQRVAQVDAAVQRTFTSVQHLLAPPGALFTPAMLVKVARGPRAT
jgi:2-polyprenyl-6-methoxyphenol hydroxylase-like FAD-dependent oxidoreductase